MHRIIQALQLMRLKAQTSDIKVIQKFQDALGPVVAIWIEPFLNQWTHLATCTTDWLYLMLDIFIQPQTTLDLPTRTADCGKCSSLIDYLGQVRSREVIFF